jgi:carboxymethylenebutenolidase
VYGFYAGNDARITSTVAPTEQAMKDAGKKYDPVTYDGAGHGFMRAGEAPDANAANTAARQAGFKRWVSLMGGVR